MRFSDDLYSGKIELCFSDSLHLFGASEFQFGKTCWTVKMEIDEIDDGAQFALSDWQVKQFFH